MNVCTTKPAPFWLLLLLLAGAAGCRTKLPFGRWAIASQEKDTDGLAWSPFIWRGAQLGDRYFERTSMDIPATVEGVSRPVTFQFDLGANISVFYGNPLSALAGRKIEDSDYGPLALSFGDLMASTAHAYVMKDYGGKPLGDTVHLGALGADLFQHGVLIIDYPGRRFAVADSLPPSWRANMSPVGLDGDGRMILPLQLGEQTYRALFDNGSSLFPLLVPARDIRRYSEAAPDDTIPVTSWGKKHDVVGRPLAARFVLGGASFESTRVYTDHRPEAVSEDYDAITGNALFWEHVIILDFRNRRFGIQLK